jgi:hypothetical protein
MIRGAIEVVTTEAVQGWIHCDHVAMSDQTILAYSGEQCVGSGRANVFRSDLVSAGLGDGKLGFSFPISVDPETLETVVVKLEGSDAVLLQTGARVGKRGAGAAVLKRSSVLAQLGRLKWALKHGRIGQADFDFLRTLYSFGVYERGLVRRRSADDHLVVDSWRVVARNLFEALVAMEVEVFETKVSSPEQFKLEMTRIACNPELLPVVALRSDEPASIQVAEGSHVVGNAAGSDSGPLPASAAKYVLTTECLLMLDSRAASQLAVRASIEIATATVPASD